VSCDRALHPCAVRAQGLALQQPVDLIGVLAQSLESLGRHGEQVPATARHGGFDVGPELGGGHELPLVARARVPPRLGSPHEPHHPCGGPTHHHDDHEQEGDADSPREALVVHGPLHGASRHLCAQTLDPTGEVPDPSGQRPPGLHTSARLGGHDREPRTEHLRERARPRDTLVTVRPSLPRDQHSK